VFTLIISSIHLNAVLAHSRLFIPRHSLLIDARYLHKKFSVLKDPGMPTAVLETLVADKRVAIALASPRPATPMPTITPLSPLSMPPTNIQLGSRVWLCDHEQSERRSPQMSDSRGMLSRGASLRNRNHNLPHHLRSRCLQQHLRLCPHSHRKSRGVTNRSQCFHRPRRFWQISGVTCNDADFGAYSHHTVAFAYIGGGRMTGTCN